MCDFFDQETPALSYSMSNKQVAVTVVYSTTLKISLATYVDVVYCVRGLVILSQYTLFFKDSCW